jgi:hypothetical protein
MHTLRKLRSTLTIVSSIFMARTFGEYRHSVWGTGSSYAVYRWRGKVWEIPMGPLEDCSWD